MNSAALHESLLESELFGHVKGAFTGADRTRVGRFEAATGGDIFLDEIGDLPLATQAKLLRVLQEKVIEKVGDHAPIAVDVRVITATNKDLHRLMAQGRFREDLFYRIGVIPVHLPPLKERREDIPLLVKAFIDQGRRRTRKPITGITAAALELSYPTIGPATFGNSSTSSNMPLSSVPRESSSRSICRPPLAGPVWSRPRPGPRRLRPGGRRRERLIEAVTQAGGRKAEAARLLGINRVTLWKLLKAHQIQVDKIIRG